MTSLQRKEAQSVALPDGTVFKGLLIGGERHKRIAAAHRARVEAGKQNQPSDAVSVAKRIGDAEDAIARATGAAS